MNGCVAGVDLGGTQVRVAVGGPDGSVAGELKAPSHSFAGSDQFIAWVAAAIEQLGAGRRPEKIGIGSAGPLDPVRGTILNAANLPPFCRQLAIVERLSAATGIPAFLENDANVAAVGEHSWGAGKGTRDMVYVTWSTGIGAGIITGGRLYSGSRGNAGEIGHMVIDPDGPECLCGQRGCTEAIAGGRGLERETGRPAGEVFAAAAGGDASARAVVERAALAFGQALLNTAGMLDPEVIVIGGGVTNSWDLVAETVGRPLRTSPFIGPERRPDIRKAVLGDAVGLIGALEWARQN